MSRPKKTSTHKMSPQAVPGPQSADPDHSAHEPRTDKIIDALQRKLSYMAARKEQIEEEMAAVTTAIAALNGGNRYRPTGLIPQIREAISSMGKNPTFRLDDIAERIDGRFTRSQISIALGNLKQHGKLVVVEAKKGRGQNVFTTTELL